MIEVTTATAVATACFILGVIVGAAPWITAAFRRKDDGHGDAERGEA